jgi:hypothetical protein
LQADKERDAEMMEACMHDANEKKRGRHPSHSESDALGDSEAEEHCSGGRKSRRLITPPILPKTPITPQLIVPKKKVRAQVKKERYQLAKKSAACPSVTNNNAFEKVTASPGVTKKTVSEKVTASPSCSKKTSYGKAGQRDAFMNTFGTDLPTLSHHGPGLQRSMSTYSQPSKPNQALLTAKKTAPRHEQADIDMDGSSWMSGRVAKVRKKAVETETH